MANTEFKMTHKGLEVKGEKGRYSRYIIWGKFPGVKFWRKVGSIRRMKKPDRAFEDDCWLLTIFKRGNAFDSDIRQLALTIGMDRFYTNMPTLE